MKHLYESILDDEEDILDNQTTAEDIKITKLKKLIDKVNNMFSKIIPNLYKHKKCNDIAGNPISKDDLVVYEHAHSVKLGVVSDIDKTGWINVKSSQNTKPYSLHCGLVFKAGNLLLDQQILQNLSIDIRYKYSLITRINNGGGITKDKFYEDLEVGDIILCSSKNMLSEFCLGLVTSINKESEAKQLIVYTSNLGLGEYFGFNVIKLNNKEIKYIEKI